ncbi:unnamed protein product [Prorocentrum cordatum]|uniref:Uncharacterized protein n=1 Tax=Prorocentrum cordatum TaxID=2364126 RepID=A0ABN9Q6H0_9DINO|nr:unnamed protein product [Polarella glacialis]
MPPALGKDSPGGKSAREEAVDALQAWAQKGEDVAVDEDHVQRHLALKRASLPGQRVTCGKVEEAKQTSLKTTETTMAVYVAPKSSIPSIPTWATAVKPYIIPWQKVEDLPDMFDESECRLRSRAGVSGAPLDFQVSRGPTKPY